MDNTLYVTMQNQRVLRRALDVAASNMANVATNGFKADAQLTEMMVKDPARARDLPKDVRFSRDWGQWTDFSQGALRRTDQPLDVALEGPGFFTVQSPDGAQWLTRDGSFQIEANGDLVTKQGYPVLDEAGNRMVFDPQGAAPTISPDGAIRIGDAVVARLGVVDVDEPQKLTKVGDNAWQTNDAVVNAVAEPRVQQGMLEGSNVRPVIELVRLIEISRAYEGASRMSQTADDLRKNALDRLGRSA